MLQRAFLAVLLFGTAIQAATADDKPKAADNKAAPAKAGKAKKADADTGDKTLPTKDQLAKAGDITARVVKVDPAEKLVTVATMNPEVANGIATLQAQIRMQAYNTNVVDRTRQIANMQMDIARKEQQLYKGNGPQIEIQALDDAKIRLADPPPQYDAKGNPRKLTPYERRALQGPGNSWGYPGDFDGLKPDQMVRIFLLKKRDTSKRSGYQVKDTAATPKEAGAPPSLYTVEIRIIKDTDH
jgi:hypothetical protein